MYNEGTANARTSQERPCYYNGIETPQEAAKEKCKLRAQTKATGSSSGENKENYLGLKGTSPFEHRLDPDEPKRKL